MANEVRIRDSHEQKAKIRETTGQEVGEIRVSNLGNNPAVAPTPSSKVTSARVQAAPRMQAARMPAAPRIQAARVQAAPRVQAARVQAAPRVQAARVQAAPRLASARSTQNSE